MGKEDYDLLKAEINSIAESLKQFPEGLQEKVFDMLVSALLGHPVPQAVQAAISQITDQAPQQISTAEKRNYVEVFKNLLAEKDPLKKLNDMEFAAVVSYFFTNLAPDEQKTDEITTKLLEDAAIHAGRKPPGNSKGTLSNAKNKRGFLTPGSSTGSYKLAPAGEHFVKNELPKKSK